MPVIHCRLCLFLADFSNMIIIAMRFQLTGIQRSDGDFDILEIIDQSIMIPALSDLCLVPFHKIVANSS